jgi:hypothetical protein
MHNEQITRFSDPRNGREIPQRVVWQRSNQAHAHGELAARHQQRVSVRSGFRHDIGAYHAAAAGTIIDDERLAQALRKFLSDRAAQRIVAAARRIRHDQPDRLRWITLGSHRRTP